MRIDSHGLLSSSSNWRAASKFSCPWSGRTAAGRCDRSPMVLARAAFTVACIASATEAKKKSGQPFFARQRSTIFNSAEKIAASVPSLPHSVLFRLPGSREPADQGLNPTSASKFWRHPLPRSPLACAAIKVRQDIRVAPGRCRGPGRFGGRSRNPPSPAPGTRRGPRSCRKPGRARRKNRSRSMPPMVGARAGRRRPRVENKTRAARKSLG